MIKIGLKETLFERTFEAVKIGLDTTVAYLTSVSRYFDLFDM